MSDPIRYALVGLIVLVTHFQEGITGFGCTVLALPFVVLLLGLHVAVPVLVIQAWVLSLYIVLEARRQIVWAEFGRIVLLVGVGLPFGMWMAKTMPETALKWLLAVFMVAVGAEGLVATTKPPSGDMSRRARWFTTSLLPIGGVVHGAFGTGGPMVVAYAAKAIPDKSLFRVTLCLLWLSLNTVMIGQWIASSSLDAGTVTTAAFCLPFTVLGMILGNRAHYRIREVPFRRLVYGVLVASGGVLVWSLLR